ncbi:MAG: winged helix DNA-binding domain-containing protein [Actinomycetota bacterium]|nr:winged helix DNA-binding domain-containing protein [Actinomycetota bacterium]
MLGIQAQDTRAAGLALRSRVPGVERASIAANPGLVRTWTARGTVHLIAGDDRPWIHALTGPRNAMRFEGMLAKRGNLDLARELLPAALDLLALQGPLSRADLLARLAERAHPCLDPYSVNVFIPWIAAQGLAAGLPDGRFRATEPPPVVDEDKALATLGVRYLGGYGPAGPADLARWSGLSLGTARRALRAAGDLEPAGDDLLALPGTLDAEPPPAPSALLLAAFDTSMLGWRSREPLLAAAHDGHILPGGGILRPVVLARGTASGTWRLGGSGRRRRLEIEWFGRAAATRALRAEAADVARFLGLELRLVS